MADNETALAAFRAWQGAPMALATVISTWGSAPRPRGSHMLVHADGRLEGSVSGGCVEGDVLALAAEVLASGKPE
jgi:xanthine dehydrogenase accessory factor